MTIIVAGVCCALAAAGVYLVMAARLSAERRLSEQREKTLNATFEQMLQRFSDIAAERLAERERSLAGRNSEQVKPLFDAMKATSSGSGRRRRRRRRRMWPSERRSARR
jgi:hypothetical protein